MFLLVKLHTKTRDSNISSDVENTHLKAVPIFSVGSIFK